MSDFSKIKLEFGDHCRTICHFEQMRPDTRHRDKEYPAYFAVFDGHSGHRCGEYVREHLGGYGLWRWWYCLC